MKWIVTSTLLAGLCAVGCAVAAPDIGAQFAGTADALEPPLSINVERVPGGLDYSLPSIQDALLSTQPEDIAPRQNSWFVRTVSAPDPPVVVLVMAGLACLSLAAVLRSFPERHQSLKTEDHRKGRRRVKVEVRMMAN